MAGASMEMAGKLCSCTALRLHLECEGMIYAVFFNIRTRICSYCQHSYLLLYFALIARGRSGEGKEDEIGG
jgi:aerobic-type carbon monoxide dehydrogenase small subunit (CoxS/CutS family)